MTFQSFWKTEPKSAEQAREDRAREKRRQLARYEAFKHFHGCCAKCGVPLKLKPSEARHEFEIAHAHEEPPRSLGGDPTNPRMIVILCFKCHDRVTRHLLFIVVVDPERGTFGPLEWRSNAQRTSA